MFIVSFVRQL